MDTITRKLGETIPIIGGARNAAGADIFMDGTWSAACRITRDRIGGTVVAEPAMAISGGQAVTQIDTREAGWTVGTYFYDIRITNPDGDDFWTDPIKLKLEPRNAVASTEVTP